MLRTAQEPPARQPAEQLHQLDALRGLCALAVVFYHVEFSHPGRELSLFRNGSLFVDFFFVLSGFIMLHSYRSLPTAADLKRFMGLRFFRIYPLHLLLLFVFLAYELLQYVLVEALGMSAHTAPFSTNNGYAFVLNSLLLNGMGLHELSFNVPAWSISTEFWTYVVFGLALANLGSRPSQLAVAFATLSIAALGVLASHPTPSLTGDPNLFFARCLYGFFLGAVLRLATRVPAQKAAASSAARGGGEFAQLAALSLAVALVCSVDPERGWLELFVPLSFALVIATFVHWPATGVIRLATAKPLLWMGKVSYSIYMVHMITLLVIQSFARIVLHAPMKNDIVQVSPLLGSALLLLYVAATLMAASITYRFVEEPGRRFGRALLGGRLANKPSDSLEGTHAAVARSES